MHFYTRFAAFAAMTIISVASIMAQTTQKWGNTALRVAAAAAVRQDSRTASADSIDAVQAEATASSIMEMPRISVADSCRHIGKYVPGKLHAIARIARKPDNYLVNGLHIGSSIHNNEM